MSGITSFNKKSPGATMMPSHCPSKGVSPPERRVFDLFKNDPKTFGWYVLHQLHVGPHVSKWGGEGDFIVLAPKLGVFSLEVKGVTKVENGQWYYRYDGKNWEKDDSPLVKAEKRMHNIMKWVKVNKDLSKLTKLLYSFGVIIRGTPINKKSIEFAEWQIWDKSKNKRPINQFIHQLAKRNSQFTQKERPTHDDIELLVEKLRPEIEAPTTYLETDPDVKYAFNKFTEDQFDVLDGVEESKKAFVKGGAGTGKTFIACELAKRELAKGHRVFFTYYTKDLKRDIEVWLGPEIANDKKLKVTHFHNAMQKILRKYNPGLRGHGVEWFNTDMPLHVVDALSHNNDQKFDTVIIDEGQDLVTEPNMLVLDNMLSGGLKKGMCYIFGDVERQAIFDRDIKEINNLLENNAFARYPLLTNCRNTKEIASAFSRMSGFEMPKKFLSDISGPPVDYEIYKDDDDHNSKLDQTIKHLLKAGTKGEHITILSSVNFAKSIVSKLEPSAQKGFHIVDRKANSTFQSHDEVIRFHTIHSFKGRERTSVIVTDLFDLYKGHMTMNPLLPNLLYVAMSRAVWKLKLFVPEMHRPTIERFKNKNEEFDLDESINVDKNTFLLNKVFKK